MSEIVVAKMGGSTLGSHDTALADVVELQRKGLQPVIVHGGGALISEWLDSHNVSTRFEQGVRVTDEESLRVVVAGLAGAVGQDKIADVWSSGWRGAGMS